MILYNLIYGVIRSQSILQLLEEKQRNCNQEFRQIFSEAQRMAIELDFEIKLPRLVKTMNHGPNYLTEEKGDKAIENYYCCSIYIIYTLLLMEFIQISRLVKTPIH